MLWAAVTLGLELSEPNLPGPEGAWKRGWPVRLGRGWAEGADAALTLLCEALTLLGITRSIR